MNENDKRALRRLLGTSSAPQATTDILQGLLLQVVFALLMVFVIANFIFIDREKKRRADEVMDLNQQKLTVALEKTAEDHRIRYGLNALMTQGTDGRRTFEPETHVKNGRIVLAPAARRAFATGSAAAYADYGDLPKLTEVWRTDTLTAAGLKCSDLSPSEIAWLEERLLRQIEEVKLDTRGVQRALAARIQRHWIEHPENLPDAKDVDEIAETLRARSLKIVSETAGSNVLP